MGAWGVRMGELDMETYKTTAIKTSPTKIRIPASTQRPQRYQFEQVP
jgi:hypothetical protein